MSYKRSRATFEADNHAPYAIFGTPLPDEGERDDGSYLPLWKQDVRDDKGRRRLHGAFTGGFSAGYFNTVGSKEGWTPSTFVSSRADRRRDGAGAGFKSQRAEDFMDDEDMADADEARTLKTSQAFSGLGFSTQEELRAGGLMGLLRAKGDTMGLRLLRRMGWKEGQGIGPKVRRAARLELERKSEGAATDATTYLFAPENTQMIQFVRKTDRRGLGGGGGGGGGGGRGHEARRNDDDENDDDDNNLERDQESGTSLLETERPPKPKTRRGGFGVGVLNDTGSDEEDPYEMGPKIKYNRVMGGDKKKKPASKKASSTAATAAAAANPSLKKTPIFTLKKTIAKGGMMNLRRCQDGRLPLDGFILSRSTPHPNDGPLVALSRYAPPPVPPGWKSAKNADRSDAGAEKTAFISTADAARASTHDFRSRAAVLGEKALPGKSVFDYISAVGRDKIAAASGKQDLPPARGEAVPEEASMMEEERQKALWERVPRLDADTATAALARGSRGPYADDEAKRLRYRQYLESHAASGGQALPEKLSGASDDDYLREMNEFYSCARIFKPMTGFMASRFTTAKTTTTISRGGASGEREGDGGPAAGRDVARPADPAEEAARMGMFGAMTRTVQDFYPTRLLCKRFNVKPPASSRGDEGEPEASDSRATTSTSTGLSTGPSNGPSLMPSGPEKTQAQGSSDAVDEPGGGVDGGAADADLLRAVFGDDDDDDDL